MNKIKIMYVGNKQIKYDTVCKTSAVWYGKGDIVEVSDEPVFTENGRREKMTHAERLLRYKFVWVKATKAVIEAMEKSKALQEKADAMVKDAAEAQAAVDAAAAEAQTAVEIDAVDTVTEVIVVGTIDEIKAKLPDMSKSELVMLAKSEEDDKNRKGVLKAIEDEIESR